MFNQFDMCSCVNLLLVLLDFVQAEADTYEAIIALTGARLAGLLPPNGRKCLTG